MFLVAERGSLQDCGTSTHFFMSLHCFWHQFVIHYLEKLTSFNKVGSCTKACFTFWLKKAHASSWILLQRDNVCLYILMNCLVWGWKCRLGTVLIDCPAWNKTAMKYDRKEWKPKTSVRAAGVCSGARTL